MRLLRALIRNHPLANILFVLVLFLGTAAYLTMPREQDPEINFNWVNITTILPGASAADVERRVTNPLEDAIKGVSDLRFVVSTSRENASNILVRFTEISEREFDKRITDLRREIQNKANSELPEEADDPEVLEITTSNGFPTAILVLQGQAQDETLRRSARLIQADLERIAGVDRVMAPGLRDPEIRIRFDGQRLAARGLTPNDLADALRAWFRDVSAGSVKAGDAEWLVRVIGQTEDLDEIARIPVLAPDGRSVLVGDVAQVERARSEPSQLVSVGGRPAVTFSVTKKRAVNTIELVERLRGYVDETNPRIAGQGLNLFVGDDQTVPTRKAIGVMQTNAAQGLVLVVLVCWIFLGWKVAILVGLGIPFSLAGTFAVLDVTGFTLNVSVLLGTVIALGMLVDDAVVVVEAIYYRIERGQDTLGACLDGVQEVWKPVLASIVTTMAAFLPLMLMPGIVGKFMFVIPFVVTVALLISLVEAFWMLPTHVLTMNLSLSRPGRIQRIRNAFNRRLRLAYGRLLVRVLRHPLVSAAAALLLVAGAGAAFATGAVQVQFFAFDSLRVFYINADMPPAASLEETLTELERIDRIVADRLGEGEVRSVIAQAGLKFTETEPLYGPAYGQLIVSLLPESEGGRSVSEIIDDLRDPVMALDSPSTRSFLQISGGPPRTRPISVKVRGDDYTLLRSAVEAVKAIVRDIDGTTDIVDDDVAGRPEFNIRLDAAAVRDLGLNPAALARTLRMAVDGEVVAEMRADGERIEMRVQAARGPGDDIGALLQMPISLLGPEGRTTTLKALTWSESRLGRGVFRHYNLRRAITVEANIESDAQGRQPIDSFAANALVREGWEKIRNAYPGIDLEFGGELEDIEESLDSMAVLFPLGVGLIYLILAAQFRSYFQPLLMITTVPLAFAGVTIGLLITGNPLSLFTMYGVIALTGIAVNSAIVLTDAANTRLEAGFPLMHAIVQAGRRRVVPVLITSLTTIAGLFSLAIGLGGKSLLWGPVASSIVWGLGVATMLTLFVVPLLYAVFMRPWQTRRLPVRRA